MPHSPHLEADEELLSSETTSTESPTLYDSDKLHFGKLWPIIRDSLSDEDLDLLITERRLDISRIKETWRPFIQKMTGENGPWQERSADFQSVLETGRLIPAPHGSGGAYFLLDQTNMPRYVVKPFDEDMLCLNNRKQRASPFCDANHRVRDAVPLYQSAEREAAAASIAESMELPDITPWAMLAILKSDSFYDISESLDGHDKSLFEKKAGGPDKEKLCSVQPYIPEAIQLVEAMHEWFEAGLEQSDESLPLDQESFENANLLIWTTYDCDGHGSNFLLYFHSLDTDGKAIYGLKKIDNALCFPSNNKFLINYLAYLPNAKLPLSSSIREKIANIDCAKILATLKTYGLDETTAAAAIRIRVLKILARRPEMTIEELNLRMELLALPLGERLALLECSREELDRMALQKGHLAPSLHTEHPYSQPTAHMGLPVDGIRV